MWSRCGRTKYVWWNVNLCYKVESQITEVKICNSVIKRTGGSVNLPVQDLTSGCVSLTSLPCLSQHKVLAQLTQRKDSLSKSESCTHWFFKYFKLSSFLNTHHGSYNYALYSPFQPSFSKFLDVIFNKCFAAILWFAL